VRTGEIASYEQLPVIADIKETLRLTPLQRRDRIAETIRQTEPSVVQSLPNSDHEKNAGAETGYLFNNIEPSRLLELDFPK
jgi:hypothetical protein